MEEQITVYLSVEKKTEREEVTIKPLKNFLSVEDAIKYLQTFLKK